MMDAGSHARAARRRASFVIRRHTEFDQIKAAEYVYWQSQPAHMRLAAGAELAADAYAMKGVHVSRLQRSLVRVERA